jgi:hypothetical protein
MHPELIFVLLEEADFLANLVHRILEVPAFSLHLLLAE